MDLYFEQASPEDKNSVMELCGKKDFFLYYLGFDSKEDVNEALKKSGFFDKIFADTKRYPVIAARDLQRIFRYRFVLPASNDAVRMSFLM